MKAFLIERRASDGTPLFMRLGAQRVRAPGFTTGDEPQLRLPITVSWVKTAAQAFKCADREAAYILTDYLRQQGHLKAPSVRIQKHSFEERK